MSRPAPTPKQSIIQTLLFASVIFLGFTLIQNAFAPPKDNRTSAEVWALMRDMNAQVRDVAIAQEKQKYLHLVNQELNDGKMSPAEKEAKELEAIFLVADTEYKGGVRLHDANRLTPAYQLLHDNRERFKKADLWEKPMQVAALERLTFVNPSGERVNRDPEGKFDRTAVTPAQLYEEVRTDLLQYVRTDPVMGFIPGFAVIDWLVGLTGHHPGYSYALAALFLAVIVRAMVWPLAQRQMMWARQAAQLSPLMNELKQKYKDKPQEMQQQTMALYREYGINPAAGCLPVLVQMPLFLVVYQCMWHYRFEFTNGMFLWINPGFAGVTNGWTAPNLGEKDYLLLVIYAISMVVTTLLTPISDPNNAKQQRIMGLSISVLFGIMMFFWPVPSAFVLYWIFTNIFATAQSLRAYRLPVPPLVKVNAPNGAVYPLNGNGTIISQPKKSTGQPKIHKPKKKKR